MKKAYLSLLLFAMTITSHAQHFITDAAYRQKTETAFQQKMKLIGAQFYNIKGLKVTPEEQEALRFLYAYMPVADATDYPTAYHLNNVRTALQTRREMAWGKQVPELLFRHFVVPMRVNNEPLDDSRALFYKELKQRVKGLSMKDAILEVNHWCHEHVTYEPSDARTSSPLQSIRTGRGRCGEESTFTVAALRSVGIPARQVYTPRWAHTDDNHAWVEAWADGKWYFLGACEPEPVLNLGWFNAPASRAMLMHTRAFGDYRGPEEVMLRTGNFTEINLIDNYGSSARTDFKIVDRNGKPVDDARVDFKIYNYAEFYTAASKYTNAKGETFLTAGEGDMIVWASKNGKFGYAKASFGKDKLITIKLEYDESTRLTGQELNIVPPSEKSNLPTVTPAQRQENDRRFAYEDSVRNAYISTFPTEESLKGYAYPQAIPYIIKARGNWRVIKDFVEQNANRLDRAMELLSTLSNKDLRDMQRDILDDNMNARSNQLSPRVEDELITSPFKQALYNAFSEADRQRFRQNPALLVDWIRTHIKLNPDTRAMRIPQTPMGIWKSRLTDERSRDIFFVDLARSLDIEAQKDVVTQKVQYRHDGQWMDVNFNQSTPSVARTGTLLLDYQPTPLLDNPKYYSYFTISKIVDGRTQLLNFEEGQVDMGGGTSWAGVFKDGTQLDEGTYLLVTGQRLADGSVLASSTIFGIEAGKTTRVDLKIRETTDGVKIIGNFDSESKLMKDGKEVSILSQTGRGYFVVGVLGVGQEPTNHALHDIAKLRDKLDEWGRPFVLLFENEAAAQKFNKAEFGQLPKNTIFGIDQDGKIKHQIATQMKLKNETQLPMFVIADTFNRVVFVCQGYTIGLGEQILKVAQKL